MSDFPNVIETQKQEPSLNKTNHLETLNNAIMECLNNSDLNGGSSGEDYLRLMEKMNISTNEAFGIPREESLSVFERVRQGLINKKDEA